jgi:hypothetical protein
LENFGDKFGDIPTKMDHETRTKLRRLCITVLQEGKEEMAEEDQQAEKLMTAKTGEPITLIGYGVVDDDGNDTGKRFIRKEDAEKYIKKNVGLYLDQEAQKTRRIAFVHCEDEENCGFLVEFKHPNCTFFFCKEHKKGFNLDLKTISSAGVECYLHGKMERYDILKDDNMCLSCKEYPLAILSTAGEA